MKRTKAICVDLGGTSLRAGIVDNLGKIEELLKYSIVEEDKTESGIIISKLVEAISPFYEKYNNKLAGIGIAAPGFIDLKKGIIASSPNYPEWKNFALRREIEKKLSMPVFLENDANAFALGEGWRGSGRIFESFIGITLGTGVGGGVVLEKKIWHGHDGTAGEVGHITVVPEGLRCNCGNLGCLEVYASAKAVAREARKSLGRRVNGLADQRIPEEVYRLAESGSPEAKRILEDVGYYLGIVVAGLGNLLNMEGVVIGGGLSNAWEFIYPAITKELNKRLHPVPRKTLKVVKGDLGESAALIGMARLIFTTT